MALSPKEVAEKALQAAETAREAARITAAQVEGVRAEIRGNFVNLENRQNEFWGYVQRTLEHQSVVLKKQDETFNEFETDFKKMDKRCESHDKIIFGDPKIKEDTGVIGTVAGHDSKISRGIWTISIFTTMIGLFWGYLFVFHLEDMKRGIFNPTEEEQTRLINRQIMKMVPTAKWPVPESTPAPPAFLKPSR
jgi:hypothetical protein